MFKSIESDCKRYWLLEYTPDNPMSVVKAFSKYVSTKHKSEVENYTKNGIQHHFEKNEALDCQNWIETQIKNLFNHFGYKKKITGLSSKWSIKYSAGGWQGLHAHGREYNHTKIITAVLYFNSPSSSIGDGNLITVWPKEDIVTWSEISPSPGKLVVMSGNLVHGVYPTTTDRNIIVMDFFIDDK